MLADLHKLSKAVYFFLRFTRVVYIKDLTPNRMFDRKFVSNRPLKNFVFCSKLVLLGSKNLDFFNSKM